MNRFSVEAIAPAAELLRDRGTVSPKKPSGPWATRSRSVPALFWILAAGLCVRLVAVFFLYHDQLAPQRDHFEFGWELGRVAQSVAEGRGFASPLFGDTGPTAWLPPVFVYILAGVFRLFGVYTPASALAILTLNSVFSALTAWPVFAIAGRLFDRKTALTAGWIWAFFPYAVVFAATRVWGEGLDALLLSVLVLMGLRMAETSRGTLWLAGGLFTGLATLSNPNTLSMVPALWGWGWWSLRRNGQQWVRPVLLASLGFFAVVSPWLLRNTLVFNERVPFRSNFWLEAYIGNNPEAPVMLVDWHRHPASSFSELAEYRASGELAYMKAKREQTLAYIGSHPATFFTLTLRRVAFVWTGFWSWNKRYLASEPLRLPFVVFSTALSLLMLIGIGATWRTTPAPLLAALLLCQPLIYYLTHPAPEYRHAIDPVIVILAAVGVLTLGSAMARVKQRCVHVADALRPMSANR